MRSAAAILDLFPPGLGVPVRLDFFGDTLESIRSFDPETQRTAAQLRDARPRAGQRGPAHDRDDQALPPGLSAEFGAQTRGDPLYEAISRGPPLSGPRALAAAVPWPARHPVRLSRRRADRARRPGRGRGRRAARADQGLLRRAHATRSARRGEGAALQAAGARPRSISAPRNGAARLDDGAPCELHALRPAAERRQGPSSIAMARQGRELRGRARGRGRQPLRRRRRGISATAQGAACASSSPAGRMARASASAPCSPIMG